MLSLVMILAMSVSVLAAGEGDTGTGTIIINGVVDGQTYSIYKIFSLTYYSDGKTQSISYTYEKGTDSAKKPWDDFFFGDGAKGADYVTIDDLGYASWSSTVEQNDTTAQAFSQAALAYAKEHNITATKSSTATAAPEGTTVNTLTFESMEYGYYLVDSSLGAWCVLTSASPTATIYEKNGQPEVIKSIVDSNGNLIDWNSAQIGDTISYQSEIVIRNGAENYVLHDVMDAGLTLDSTTISVEYYTKERVDQTTGDVVYSTTAITYDGGKYQITYPANNVTGGEAVTTETPPCTFEIAFDNDYIAGLGSDTKIVVSYKAKLNQNALIGAANKNEAWISYGDGNKSPSDITATYTWNIHVMKVNDADDPLANAVFTLSTDPEGNNKIKFTKEAAAAEGTDATVPSEGTPSAQSVEYDTYCVDPDGSVTEITTDSTGTFILNGLSTGTYYLTEATAPAGYNKLETPLTITISAVGGTGTSVAEGMTGRISVDGNAENATRVVSVKNNSGAMLPSTGGIGTTLFYIVGSILVLGAVIFLVVRRRMAADGTASE